MPKGGGESMEGLVDRLSKGQRIQAFIDKWQTAQVAG